MGHGSSGGMVVREQALAVPAAARGQVATSMAQAVAEARGRQEVAKTFPRDETRSDVAMVRACRNPRFANLCLYRYKRGTTPVEGATIKFAREAARAWGNIAHGIAVLDRDGEWCTVQGWAFDMEANVYIALQSRFRLLQQRKDYQTGETRWVEPDERDAREMINSVGARVERNAILQLLPEYQRDEWLDVARHTMKATAEGEIKADPDTARRAMVRAFNEMDVSPDQIEAVLGHSLDEGLTAEELEGLRLTWRAIRDGETTREEAFPKQRTGPSDAEVDAYAGVPAGATLDDQLAAGVPPKKARKPRRQKPAGAGEDPGVTPEEEDAMADLMGGGGREPGEEG